MAQTVWVIFFMFATRTQSLLQKSYFTPGRIFTAGVLLFILLTRWALAPRYLFYFDSANFALALERFNPALHQPQPPGYPLFVGLTRLIHYLIQQPQDVLLAAGLIGAVVATLLIRVLASDLFGRAAGFVAMVLLASNPVFWFGGITNEIRVFLAVTSVSLALLGWRALTRPDPGWLYATFAAWGVTAGFRPIGASLLAPVCIWALLRKGRTLRHRVFAVALLFACVLPWAAVTLRVMGGPLNFLQICREYASSQFQSTSSIYGATPSAAGQMFLNAVVWNLFGGLIWIWAVPIAAKSASWRGSAYKLVFLCAAFLPSFLFSGLIHIGDPDQALASVAILCVVGAGALSATFQLDEKPPFWKRVGLLSVGIIAAHSLLFFRPPTRIARAASYKAAVAVDRLTANALESVAEVRGKGPITIVHYGSPVASRQLMYYFPNDYLVVLPGSPDHPQPGGEPQVFFQHRPLTSPQGEGLLLPGARGILCITAQGEGPPGPGKWEQHGAIYFQSPVTAPAIRIGPYLLVR